VLRRRTLTPIGTVSFIRISQRSPEDEARAYCHRNPDDQNNPKEFHVPAF
jgi:hypothetical protein